MADLARRAALVGETGALRYKGADFSLQAMTDRLIMKLQCRAVGEENLSLLERLTGLTLPDGPACPAGGEPAVFWCAPGEWLIVSASLSAEDLCGILGGSPESVNCAATDAGSGLTCIRIAGDGALARLAGGCSAPLEDTIEGHYLLTRLFGLPALIHKVDDSTAFDLYIDRSTSSWLWDSLLA